jgi:hypothetical protein
MAVSCHISCPKHPNQMSATSVLLCLLVETYMQISGCTRQFVHIACINFGAPRLIVLILTDGLYCCCVCFQYVLHDSSTRRLIQGDPGGNINILGSHSNGHSKKKRVCACVLLRMVNGAISLYRSLNLAPNIVLHSRRTAQLYEALESV